MKVAEVKVSYSIGEESSVKIKSSEDAFNVVISQWDMDIIQFQEEVKIILLNRANVVLGIYHLSKGGTAQSTVDIKIVLSVALKTHSSAIIMIHNHPTGKLEPSKSDKILTKRLKEACQMVDLVLLDHLIITKDSFYSFNDNNML